MVLARRPPASDFDLSLVLRARSGDPDAFSQLMDEYGATVRRLVSRFVHDVDDARDVEQETWIRAASKLESLREPGRFSPWVKSIARHASLNFIASRKRRQAHVSTFEECGTDEFEDGAAETPERHVLSRDNQRKVWEALGALSERDRTALYLREYKDLPYADIAARLGISRSAAEVCVFRARERFRVLFAEVEQRPTVCGVDPLRLSVLVDGDGDAQARDALVEHLRECDNCQERVTTMRAGQALYRNLPAFGIPIGVSTGILGTLTSTAGGLVAKGLGALGIGGGTAAGGSVAVGTGAGGASIVGTLVAGTAAVVISASAVTGGRHVAPEEYDAGPLVAAVTETPEADQTSGVASRPLFRDPARRPDRTSTRPDLAQVRVTDGNRLFVNVVSEAPAALGPDTSRTPVASPVEEEIPPEPAWAGINVTASFAVEEIPTSTDAAGTEQLAAGAATVAPTASPAPASGATATSKDTKSTAKDEKGSSGKDDKNVSKDTKSSAKDEKSSGKDDKNSSKDTKSSSKEEKNSSGKDDKNSSKDTKSSSKDEKNSSGKDDKNSSKDAKSSAKDEKSSGKDDKNSSKDTKSSSKEEKSPSGKDDKGSSKDAKSSAKDEKSPSGKDDKNASKDAKSSAKDEKSSSGKDDKNASKDAKSSSKDEKNSSGKDDKGSSKDDKSSSKDEKNSSGKDDKGSSKDDRPSAKDDKSSSGKDDRGSRDDRGSNGGKRGRD